MYNALTNEWKNEEHQMTYDVRQPKTQAYVLEKMRKFVKEREDVDVVRFTTFFISSLCSLMNMPEKNL